MPLAVSPLFRFRSLRPLRVASRPLQAAETERNSHDSECQNVDVYTRITNRIVADLEQGARPWLKPWNAQHAAGRIARPLRHNSTPYRGINVLVLWAEAETHGYACPLWMTYRQAPDLGALVCKGGQLVEQEILFMKGNTVFNCEQIEGLAPQYYAMAQPRTKKIERIDRAESFFANAKPEVQHGGNMAYYAMQPDRIQMPPFEAFRDPEAYYSTLAHETAY
jgi:antirestriction protein ArdC